MEQNTSSPDSISPSTDGVPHPPGHVISPADTAPAAMESPQPAADVSAENSDSSPAQQPAAIFPTTQPSEPGPEPQYPAPPAYGFNDQQAKAKKRRFAINKKAALLAGAVFVALGGSAAAYFGYYTPNQPANIWKTALSRTGKGYDKLSDYAVSQYQSKNSGIKLDGNFKTTGFLAADGTFGGNSKDGNGEFNGSLSVSGLKLDGDIRLIKSAAGSPDVYFKLNGLQGMGDLLAGFGVPPAYASSLNGLNDKWYFIDHSLFNQISGSSSSSLQITADDVKSVLKAVGDAGKQNIFTTDPSKMAFTVKTNVGKEKKDGQNVYHFVAAVNKNNLKNYVTTLCGNLKNSSLKKFFSNDSQQVADTLGCTSAAQAVNNFDSTRTADVYVDLRTKLIQSVRITDPKAKADYFEIGQDYQGGSNFPFNLKTHSENQDTLDDVIINLGIDTKTNKLSLSASAKEQDKHGGNDLNADFSMNVVPNNAAVNVQKPDNAENIMQLLNDLGLGQIYQGSIQSTAKDTERKTDIKALQGQIEAYWADQGMYPTLAQINNAAWRTANFKGIDTEAFKDPDGSSGNLAAAPAAHVYAYVPLPAGCNDADTPCTDFSLTATLDSGDPFTVQSLNTDLGPSVYQN